MNQAKQDDSKSIPESFSAAPDDISPSKASGKSSHGARSGGPRASKAHYPRKDNHPRHKNRNRPQKKPSRAGNTARRFSAEIQLEAPKFGELPRWDVLSQPELMGEALKALSAPAINYSEHYVLGTQALQESLQAYKKDATDKDGLCAALEGRGARVQLLEGLLSFARSKQSPLEARGIIDKSQEGYGFLVFAHDNYKRTRSSPFLPKSLLSHYGLESGEEISVVLSPPRESEACPYALTITSIHFLKADKKQACSPVEEKLPPIGSKKKFAGPLAFSEQVPYYPTERIILEPEPDTLSKSEAVSMRVIDLVSPIGLGQRGLIVAPPRTGKTVLLQGIAKTLCLNCPQAHLMVLLVDERPEEVTDFKRSLGVDASHADSYLGPSARPNVEVLASTFDASAQSHVHVAEVVIERARRIVEHGGNAIVLLDSITRLARAYNTLMPSSGKILSGGVEAGALQAPKRFFGSARNIEGGGSLTILGTALVETGSKMDEVVFEEFKGTGNMELHLDRELSNKRIYPALSFERSGTRKEELLYHGDEMQKVHALRRAMKGVPSLEAMEMLIGRVQKTKTNAEFLMSMSR